MIEAFLYEMSSNLYLSSICFLFIKTHNPVCSRIDLIIHAAFASKDRWAEHLRHAGLTVRVSDNPNDLKDLSKVEFAICWQPKEALLQQCPNLKALQSMGAGVDSLLSDPTLPRHVPLLRVIDPLMAERMAIWVLWGVINIQRKCDAYLEAQRQSKWDKSIENFKNIDNAELRVGVLGAGVMGGAVIDTLKKLKYNVASWTRRNRKLEGVECYSGREQLLKFAANVDILVCLLPLTEDTRGILNAELFSAMKHGSAVINAARGGHLLEKDLLDALDSGKLSSAILDVFTQEPLSEGSRLWQHPSVRVFPHVSSMTNIESAVDQMLENRQRILEGRAVAPELVVDWEAGY
jgi:glyoxylate/hydroxypyruvate reductase